MVNGIDQLKYEYNDSTLPCSAVVLASLLAQTESGLGKAGVRLFPQSGQKW